VVSREARHWPVVARREDLEASAQPLAKARGLGRRVGVVPSITTLGGTDSRLMMPFRWTASRAAARLRRFWPAAPAALEGVEARGRERYRRAGLTAATALGGRGLTLILSLVTVPLTLNYLGPERYGVWLTISSVIALLAFTDLGIGSGLLNAVTQTMAGGELAKAREQISSATILLTLLAVALTAMFVVCYPIIPWATVLAVSSPTAASETGMAVAAWAACFLIGMPLGVVAQVRMARQEGYVVHVTAAAGNVAAVGALLAVIASRQGLPFLVVAMAGPPLIASAVNGAVLFRRDAPELSPSVTLADRRTGFGLLRAGFLFFVMQIAIAVAFTSDTLVVAQLVGPIAVAEYGVTSRLFMIPAAFVALGIAPLWPAYGEAIARGDVAWARLTLIRSLKAGLFISVPAAAALVAFGLPIIALWVGPSVTPPFVLLLGFGIWVALSTVGNSVAMLLNGAHEIRIQAAAAALMALVNLALSIWLTSRIGVAGVMWGTVIAYSVFVLVPMALYVPGVLRRIELRQTRQDPAPPFAVQDL
jgi:O-antigen/teichoic acid export membrane protein